MTQTTIEIPPGEWTLLTNTDITHASYQASGTSTVYIKGTAGATAPTDTDGAFSYTSGRGEVNQDIRELFLGVSGVNRLYGYSHTAAIVVIGHA